MNIFALVLCFAIAFTIALAAFRTGVASQRDLEANRRDVLQRRAETAERIADQWRCQAEIATNMAAEAVVALDRGLRPLHSVSDLGITAALPDPGDIVVQHPPTTTEADRRFVHARRSQAEREEHRTHDEDEETSDTRVSVRIRDNGIMPAPQLRDAADDH